MKILVVNDYEPSRYATGRVLRENGFEVCEAANGAEALDGVRSEAPDLVLLDVNLPDIDGFEVCRRIKDDPETSSVAVLQMSAAHVNQHDRVKGLDIGADAYLVEPVEPTELLATVRALLRMRSAERRLRVAADEWSETFDAISAGIALVDADGEIILCNRSFSATFAAGVAPVKAEICSVVFGGSDDPGGSALGALIGSQSRREVEIKARDRWFKVSLNPVTRSGVRSAVCVFDDVTDERRLSTERAAVLELEREARSVAEASRKRADFLSKASAAMAASMSVDQIVANVARVCTTTIADWCFVDLLSDDADKPRVAAVTSRSGVDAATAREGHVHALNHLTTDHPIQRVINGAHTEVYPQSLASRGRATGGLPDDLARIATHAMVCVPLSARGRVLGTVTITRDETSPQFEADEVTMFEEMAQRIALALDNARLFEEAQAANRAKDEFLATLSHELRTPLTATLGWAKMVRMGGLDQQTFDSALETIERSTEVQSQIIEDILDVSRIVTGKLHFDMQPTDLTAVSKAAVASLAPDAEKKGLTLQADIAHDLPPIWADARRVQQIVWNLLSNAIKFTAAGGSVTVAVESLGSHVRLTVSDTGKGIQSEFLPFVFERFRQGDGASTREHGGLGLGLAIVRHLVRMHGGTIQAESEGEGKGARFVVELPVGPAGRRDPNRELKRRQLPDLGGARILVVEDQGDTREWIVAVLSQCGAELRHADSVAGALTVMEEFPPDLIVSDLGLPDEDGYDLLRTVRDGSELPIIALSAYARVADRDRALDAGFSSYLLKPLDPSILASEVARLLAREQS